MIETPEKHETQLPYGTHLLPDETLIEVEFIPPPMAPERSSSIRELYRLANVTKEADLGKYGPVLASLTFDKAPDDDKHQGLYSVVFGRDSLRVAIDLVEYYPQLAEATIRRLAETQGTEFNDAREEEPGRIAHEIREPNDSTAKDFTLTRGWGWPYYGSVDATPEFVRTLTAYTKLHDKNGSLFSQSFITKSGETLQVKDAFERAVKWIESRLDANPEGIMEFKRAIPHGIENQVWKDSPDAYHHSNGAFANHEQGVSSIELEGVTHEALLDAADIYQTLFDDSRHANELRERADRLAKMIHSAYWTDDKGGYFVLGTDRDDSGKLRQLKIRTSNMGHLFNTRLLDGNSDEMKFKRDTTLHHLQSDELLSASGIRTLASDEIRYREGAYHNGSVWIWDSHHIAKGARRYKDDLKFIEFANTIDKKIINAVNKVGGFPEYLRGGSEIVTNSHDIYVFDNKYNFTNHLEQPPQEIQAWTVAAIIAAKRAVRH